MNFPPDRLHLLVTAAFAARFRPLGRGGAGSEWMIGLYRWTTAVSHS
jgi:hypothetical protein